MKITTENNGHDNIHFMFIDKSTTPIAIYDKHEETLKLHIDRDSVMNKNAILVK